MVVSFSLRILLYSLFFLYITCHQFSTISNQSPSIFNKLIVGNNRSVERRKAVTIGLNRWIRPLTIQVPDVISNLLPSSSNIIKVHDTSKLKNQSESEYKPSKTKTEQFINYDPITLLTQFDPNIFTKTLPNSTRYSDEPTLANMSGMMIPLNNSPLPMFPSQMVPLTKQFSPYGLNNNNYQMANIPRPISFKINKDIPKSQFNMDNEYEEQRPKNLRPSPYQTGDKTEEQHLDSNIGQEYNEPNNFDDNKDIKDKMNYYKKLLSSFNDDFYKEKSNSFNDMHSKETDYNESGANSVNQFSKNGLGIQFNNDAWFNDIPSSKDISQQNPDGESKQQQQQQESNEQMEPSSQFDNYYNNDKSFYAAASLLNPVILDPRLEAINDNKGLNLRNKLPLIFPLDVEPNVQNKQNNPWPVTSRFKEFFKNMIHLKYVQ